MDKKNISGQWMDWAVELQAIAQNGLTYGRDVYDLERYERVREIAAEIMSVYTDIPLETVKGVFCQEKGYQTPKLDTRAAVFKEGKILLVKEKAGVWSLPGGWVDVNESIKNNTVKEVKEEAGLDVEAVRLIAIQDRNLHNKPLYAWSVCKVFMLCRVLGGRFQENSETVESGYFSREELPPLAEEKTTAQQVYMCFEACGDENWKPLID